MKHLLTAIFLATATMAQAGNNCALIKIGIGTVENLYKSGLTREQAFDYLVHSPVDGLTRIQRAKLVESWLVWVYDAKATAKQWGILCESLTT